MAKEVHRQFKTEGGRFFKLKSRVEGDYIQVDGSVALERIKADFTRRMESSKYWLQAKSGSTDSTTLTNHRCITSVQDGNASFMKNRIPRKSKKKPSVGSTTSVSKKKISVSKTKIPIKPRAALAKARITAVVRSSTDTIPSGRPMTGAQDCNISSPSIPRKRKAGSNESAACCTKTTKKKNPAKSATTTPVKAPAKASIHHTTNLTAKTTAKIKKSELKDNTVAKPPHCSTCQCPTCSKRRTPAKSTTATSVKAPIRHTTDSTAKNPAKAEKDELKENSVAKPSHCSTWQCPTCYKQFEFRHAKTVAVCIHNHTKNHDPQVKNKKNAARAKLARTTPRRSSPRFVDSAVCLLTTSSSPATDDASTDKAVKNDEKTPPKEGLVTFDEDVISQLTTEPLMKKKRGPGYPRKNKSSSRQVVTFTDEADNDEKTHPKASVSFGDDDHSHHATEPMTEKRGSGRPKNKSTSAQAVTPAQGKATPARAKRFTPARAKKSSMRVDLRGESFIYNYKVIDATSDPSFVTPTPKNDKKSSSVDPSFVFSTPLTTLDTSTSAVPSDVESRTMVDGCGTESTPGIVLKSSNPSKTTFPESVQSRTMVDRCGIESTPGIVLKRSSVTRKMTFAESVHALVSDASENMPEVVCWNGAGDAFIVKERGEPLQPLLRRYFRHNNYTSLYRQLANYGWTMRNPGEYKRSFYRDGFTRDSKPAELQRITSRIGSEATNHKKPKSESSFRQPSKIASTPVVQTSTGRSAQKRKAFADACSGIQSALTEQEKHENVDTFFEDSDEEESLSVAGTAIVQENDTLPDENVDDLVSVDDGEKDDVSFGDENSSLGKENAKEESGCANIPPEPKGNADTNTMEKPKKTRVRPKKNAKHLDTMSSGFVRQRQVHVTSSQVIVAEALQLDTEPSHGVVSTASQLVLGSVQVSGEEYDRFQYSNFFQWSPITLRSTNDSESIGTKSKMASIARGSSSHDVSNIFPCTGAWSQNIIAGKTQKVLTMQNVRTLPMEQYTKPQTDSRKRPSFSPIALQALNDVSYTGVTFQGLPPEPNVLCTPSKDQADNMIQFSWHSRATIGSIAGLPHIDIDNLLGDLGDDSMIDFIVGAPNTGPQNKMRSSTPMKSEDRKRLASPLPNPTPRKRRASPLAVMPSISPFENRKRWLASPCNAKQEPCFYPL